MLTHKFNEVHTRTLAKLITWRVYQIIFVMLNTYIITGSWSLGATLSMMFLVVNSTLFWAHERFWNWFDWKRLPHISRRFDEKQIRTVGKMVLWRILMIISLSAIAWFTTGNLAVTLTFVSTTIVLNIIAYWLHERIWNGISWGKEVTK